MKLMPPDPTEEMLKAGHDAGGYEDEGEWGWASPDRTYKAMYAAAPNIEHEEIAKQIPEALRQAIIKDFVGSLEPYAWANRDIESHSIITNEDKNNKSHGNFAFYNKWMTIPLYSLEEWK